MAEPDFDLTGSWIDDGQLVHIDHRGKTVTAKWVSPQECHHQDGTGAMTPYEDDFSGSLTDRSIDGLASVCFWGKRPNVGVHNVPLKMNVSADANVLLGCWYDTDKRRKMPFTVVRAYTPVEVKLRAFIPAPAIVLAHREEVRVEKAAQDLDPDRFKDALVDPLLQGDNRTFSYQDGTDRVTLQQTVIADPEISSGRRGDPLIKFGTTHEYTASQGEWVVGMPWWWWQIKDRDHPVHVEQRQPNEENSGIEVTPHKDGLKIKLKLNASIPSKPGGLLRMVARPITAELVLEIEQEAGKAAKFRLTGSHTEFPGFELYLNGVRGYEYDPAPNGKTPRDIISTRDIEVPPNTLGLVPSFETVPLFPAAPLPPNPCDELSLPTQVPESAAERPSSGGRLSP